MISSEAPPQTSVLHIGVKRGVEVSFTSQTDADVAQQVHLQKISVVDVLEIVLAS